MLPTARAASAETAAAHIKFGFHSGVQSLGSDRLLSQLSAGSSRRNNCVLGAASAITVSPAIHTERFPKPDSLDPDPLEQGGQRSQSVEYRLG
jgi:hypothetical protein